MMANIFFYIGIILLSAGIILLLADALTLKGRREKKLREIEKEWMS